MMKHLVLGSLIILFISCEQVKKDEANMEKNDEVKNSLIISGCSGSEKFFNAYLFHKLDKDKYHFVHPYFDNSVLKEYISGKQLSNDDNHVAFCESGKFIEYLSLCMILSGRDSRASTFVSENFDEKLAAIKINRDSISKKIALLYEKK